MLDLQKMESTELEKLMELIPRELKRRRHELKKEYLEKLNEILNEMKENDIYLYTHGADFQLEEFYLTPDDLICID